MFQPENRAQITSCHCASGVSVALVSPEPTPHVELASLAGNIHVSSRRTNLRKQNTALQAAVKRVPVHTVRFFDTLKKLFEHPFTRFTHAPLIAHKRRFRGRGKFWTFFLGVLNVLSWSFERSFGVAENNSAAKSSEKLESAAKKNPIPVGILALFKLRF
jgi:hypothetical protein